MRKAWFWMRGVKILVIFAVVLAILGYATMVLWNALVPALFTGPALTYWQAVGLLILTRLLFGGLRPHGRGHFGPWHHRRARWERMTPEEREHFHRRFHGMCRGRGGDESSQAGSNNA